MVKLSSFVFSRNISSWIFVPFFSVVHLVPDFNFAATGELVSLQKVKYMVNNNKMFITKHVNNYK